MLEATCCGGSETGAGTRAGLLLSERMSDKFSCCSAFVRL